MIMSVWLQCVVIMSGRPLMVQPAHRCSSPLMFVAQEEATRIWGTKLAPSAAEGAANQAWLASLDADAWTEVVTTVSAQVMSEGNAENKQTWLARLDSKTWGAVAAAVAEVAATVQLQEPSERQTREAKRAWLARLDDSSWAVGAATLVELAGCSLWAMDDEWRAWVAALDASTWRAVSTAVATVAVEVTLQTAAGMPADEIAKAAWLVQVDTAAWGPQSPTLRETNLRGEMSSEEAAIRAQMFE